MGLATHIVVSTVHFWVIWDSYWLILWCQKTHIDSYCGVKSPFLSDLRLILWCQKSISEWFENPVNLGLKKELGLTPPPLVDNVPFFYRFFFKWELPLARDMKHDLSKNCNNVFQSVGSPSTKAYPLLGGRQQKDQNANYVSTRIFLFQRVITQWKTELIQWTIKW